MGFGALGAMGFLGDFSSVIAGCAVRERVRQIVRCERGRRRLVGWLLALAIAGGVARAHDLTPSMGRPATERKHFQGNQFNRAGNPQCISPLARPGESPREFGYYVGGGARERSRRGECRLPHEGTWGTDYAGVLIPKHVELGWWHGRRAQGGTGSYPTDGPRIVHRP